MRLGNRTYRLENRTNPVNLVLVLLNSAPIGVNLAVLNAVGAVLTAPDLREYLSDNRFRERLGAVRKPHLPDLEDH